ncbi:MAG: hypothetical protein GY820_30795 [Gammaproteobacteria bacterium]|nr:hypothetical protein [Gammaproteobacteria bacterium]
MFEDVTKSIKSSLYDRVSSPLFGAFTLSWCIWNYKLLLTLLSSMDVQSKIEHIETVLYPGYKALLLTGFAYPLVTSVLFILIYPIPAKFIYKYWHSQQIHLKKIKQDIEDESPLTIEESREIRREILNLESQYDAELNRRGAENDRLRELVRDLENNLINANKKLGPLPVGKPQELNTSVNNDKPENPRNSQQEEFEKYLASGKLENFISNQRRILTASSYDPNEVDSSDIAKAFGLVEQQGAHVKVSKKGREFFEWLLLNDDTKLKR